VTKRPEDPRAEPEARLGDAGVTRGIHPQPGRFERPPGAWFHGIAGLLALASSVGLFEGADGPELFAWLAMGAVWFGRFGTWLSILTTALARAADERARLDPRATAGALRWLGAPALVALTFAAREHDVPLRVRFFLSRGALEELAADEAPQGPWPRRAGRFTVTQRRVSAGSVQLFVSDGSSCTGFTRTDRGEPLVGEPDTRALPIAAGWYAWVDDD